MRKLILALPLLLLPAFVVLAMPGQTYDTFTATERSFLDTAEVLGKAEAAWADSATYTAWIGSGTARRTTALTALEDALTTAGEAAFPVAPGSVTSYTVQRDAAGSITGCTVHAQVYTALDPWCDPLIVRAEREWAAVVNYQALEVFGTAQITSALITLDAALQEAGRPAMPTPSGVYTLTVTRDEAGVLQSIYVEGS